MQDDLSTLEVLLKADGPLKTPKDFEGKTLGGAANDGALKLFPAFAKLTKIDESKVVPPANFQKDLGADDLSMVELVMAYERVFKIRIPNADADRFKTVQDVIHYLRKKNVLR